jgi:hypothetical protein
MPSSKRPAFIILWFALGGLALAVWLGVFAKDAKRPILPQERADRLAAANYLAGSLHADSPPSPAHWAQLLVWQDPATGLRYPLSRDASALLLAATGGRPAVAGALAFAAAAGTLGWLFSLLPRLGAGRMAAISSLVMLGVARGRDWQITDPFPFLVMAASTFAFAAWLSQRATPTKRGGWLLGCGLAGLLLCDTALALLFLAIIFADHFIARNRALAAAGLRQLAIVLALLVAAYGARNHIVTGNLLMTPTAAYREYNTTASRWFWETTQTPQANLDRVFERYDELVAIPAAHWSPPVYRKWLNRIHEGSAYAGGLVLAIAALIAALVLPARETRPAWLLVIGLCVLALLRYALSSTWWPMLTPAIVVLVVAGLHKLTRILPQGHADRLLVVLCVLQLAMLPYAAHARPSTAEYDYLRRIQEITAKIKEKPGKHLVFTTLDSETDGRIEPADLPHFWPEESILIARDLGTAKNAKLLAAMPDRTPWRVLIMPSRAGLQSYSQDSTPSPAAAPEKN